MKFSHLIIGLALIGCKPKSDLHSDSGQNSRTEEKVFGDSLKIIYRYHGDTVIQNRIDLKGTTDDGFDSSFTVTSIWSAKDATDLICDRKLRINRDRIDFIFCLDDVIKKVEQDINEADNDKGILERLNPIKVELAKIKNGNLDSLTAEHFYLPFDLLRTIDFAVYDRKTKSKLDKVRIEQYETNFSGGRNYYFMDAKNDTITNIDINEWIQ